jgi:hypothetical protein
LKFKFVFIFVISILFTSCGYKTTAHYVSEEISGKTYVEVNIDIRNAKNTVLIKDAIIELLIGKFDAQITNNKVIANTIVKGSLLSVEQKQLQTDTSGYAKVYRETVKVKITYNKKGKSIKSFILTNYCDFTVSTDSSITELEKEEAIKIAISKALSDIFSNIAVNSFK